MLSKNIINKFLFISIILLAIIAGWAVSELFTKDSTSPSNNILLNFEAVDHMGNNVSTSSYDGFSKVFFFGFTHCPDICPISANLMSNAIEQLNRENFSTEKIKFFFVTVDPARDSPERLKEFLVNFGNDFIGLTGSHESLMPIWKDFFVHVEPATTSEHQNHLSASKQTEAGEDNSNYMVQHTAFYYIFDDTNTLQSILPFGSSIDKMVEDIKKL